MSIITDALKKAESEREQKAKNAAENLAAVAVAEEEMLQERLSVSEFVEKIKSSSHTQSPRHSVLRYSNFLIVAAAILFSLLAILIVSLRTPAPRKGQFSSTPKKLPYALSGISVSDVGRYAIINGIIVGPGDSIDGAQVKEVLENEVTLTTRTGELALELKS